MTLLPNPAITQMTSQAGLYHISSNLELQRVAEELYRANCETEQKAIRNWQHVLAMSSDGMSLKPYFDDGFTAIRAGIAIHILKCEATEASVDFDAQGCHNEIPLRIKDQDGRYLNQTFWAHPISKILLPTPTKIPCSKTLPQVYRLDAAQRYYCSYGHGLSSCPDPEVLNPTSANLHDQLVNDIAVPMGAGVLTKERIREMQFRIFYHQYTRHLQNEIMAQNEEKGRIKLGLSLQNLPDPELLQSIQWDIATAIAPFYSLFGDVYVYVIGIIMICTIMGAAVGLCTRLYMEIKVNGFTYRIIFALFQGIYHIVTVPLEFIKAGYEGATRAPTEGLDGVVQPLQATIDELRQKIAELESNLNHCPSTSKTNGNGNEPRNPFDPPSHGQNGGGQGLAPPAFFSLKEKTPNIFTPLTKEEETTTLLSQADSGIDYIEAHAPRAPPPSPPARTTNGQADMTVEPPIFRPPGPYHALQEFTETERRQQAASQMNQQVHQRRSLPAHHPNTWSIRSFSEPSAPQELAQLNPTDSTYTPMQPLGEQRSAAAAQQQQQPSEDNSTMANLVKKFNGIAEALTSP